MALDGVSPSRARAALRALEAARGSAVPCRNVLWPQLQVGDPFLKEGAEKAHTEIELISVTQSAAAPGWRDETQLVGSGLFVLLPPYEWHPNCGSVPAHQSSRLKDSGMVFLAPAGAESTLMTQLENSRARFRVSPLPAYQRTHTDNAKGSRAATQS